MQEKSLESYGFKGPKPRNLGIIVVLLILFIILWSTFVIVPAGSRGVVLWWGKAKEVGPGWISALHLAARGIIQRVPEKLGKVYPPLEGSSSGFVPTR